MKKLYLESGWVLTGDKIGTVDAVVPGCVHTDLIKNGIIKDLYLRDNNLQYRWIEGQDFTYTCTFDAEMSEYATLVFEGLDTYCEVYLNGEHLGGADNMFVPHEFFVGGKLKRWDNELRVEFRSPVKEVEGMPPRRGAFTTERMNTRRMQCTYGWDWVERFVTCGIHRPVYIRYGNDMHVGSAYIVTESIDKYSAQICVELELEHYEEGGMLQIDVLSPDGEIVYSADVYSKEPLVVCRIDIAKPELWYPAGYGEHPLYTLCVTVGDNVFTETFGIRTLKILQLPDEEGSEYAEKCRALRQDRIAKTWDDNEKYSGFQVLVNGVRILCMGGNWVPASPFPSEESEDKLSKLVSLAAKMGVNMLRVWGGGHFEHRAFYDACDREGILVTQDFLMACGHYPEKEAWFLDHLRREAEFAVQYLRNHPCLAWWSGDNENAVRGNEGLEDYTGRSAAFSGLAPVIYRYDRCRQFLPSSPYGGYPYASRTVGTTHNTQFIGGDLFPYLCESDCVDYKEFLAQFIARFIAEEPVFGAANRKTLLRFLDEADLSDPDERMLEFHTKNNPSLKQSVYRMMSGFAKKMLGEPKGTEEKCFKYKYLQYEWVRVTMENLRRHIGFCNGLIYWMFNDCWPAALSWSFVDYYLVPKAAFYSFRRCAAPVVSSVTRKEDGYAVTVSNAREQATSVRGTVSFFRKNEGMRKVGETSFALDVDGYCSASLAIDRAFDGDIVVICDMETANGARDRSFFKDGSLELIPCNDGIRVTERGENSITVVADRYIHAVDLDGDCLFSDNCFSLLVGEERTVTWQKAGDDESDEFVIKAYTLA